MESNKVPSITAKPRVRQDRSLDVIGRRVFGRLEGGVHALERFLIGANTVCR